MRARLYPSSLACGLVAVVLVSCATQPPSRIAQATAGTVWPAPPDEAKIAYVRDLRGPRDIGQKTSMFRSLVNWVTGSTGENLDLHKPFAVALDEHGGLCIADTDEQAICYADLAEKKWRSYDGVGKQKFLSPVAVARRNGVFYVADSELVKVFAFRDNGASVFEIGEPLKRPVGLTVVGDTLFVVDSQLHAVLAFGLDGKLKFQFGQRGTGPGEFNFPTCLAADEQGHLLVSDTMNCRIEIFDLRGNFLSQFGSNGDTSGHFARPKGVAVDAAGHIYVVDAVFNNFQIFDGDGKLLLNVGESGSGPGEFGLPNGIAIGPDNRIYVADAFNHRVQILKYLGGHE